MKAELMVRLRENSKGLVPGLLLIYAENCHADLSHLMRVSEGGVEELHDFLKRQLVRMGWVKGNVFDDGDLLHPWLVDWEDMAVEARESEEKALEILEVMYG